MPTIEFSIDPTTGELEIHIQGVAGPTCDEVAKLIETLIGPPTSEQKTAEYYARSQVRPSVRQRGQS
ncbi:MAG: DUF2997 domain-containing protein [Anaerolineae bacterium]